MTELRKANGLDSSTPRLHKQHSIRERDRHVHPLLHSLADHGCSLSSGGNSVASTTSSSTATATTALGGVGGGGGTIASAVGISSQRSVEFDEHDIFYVSPSKRKGGSVGVVAPSCPTLRPATAYEGNNHNVVTFSNYVSEQRVTPASSHRGSLKRSKGRSNQSLCSCDAGDEAQLQPDAARPLYEYSLERRRKTHTYTCEQNAQILMRLERERNRKLSLTLAGVAGGEASEDLVQCDTTSLSDVDVIPPVPPPPAMKRNGSMRSLRLMQQLQLQQQQQQQQHASSVSSGSNNNNLAQLCSSDLLQDCTKSALDECTATLLKCTSNGNGSSIANNNNSKPDLCQPTGHSYTLNRPHKQTVPPPPFTAHEEDAIFTPHSKKSDPSLCFLPTAAAPLLSSASKYNTIGPSSDYARHLAHYSRYLQKQHQQQQLAHFQQQRCRCFSQSLLSFPSNQQQGVQQQLPQQEQQQQQQQPHIQQKQHTQQEPQQAAIFHTSSMDWSLPINSRSFGNLADIEGPTGCRVPYQKMPQHQSSSGPGMASSTFTMSSFDSDGGLKERESQTSLHKSHQIHSHSHHYHPHHHAVVGGVSGSNTPQKHHQLHSSVTSIMPWKHRQCPSRGSSSSGTNSFRFDAAKHWLAVSSILLIIGAASVAVPLALRVAASAPFEERLRVAVQLLDQVPLIDGHNDLPWNIRKFLHNKLNDFNFDEDLRSVMPWGRSVWSHTDLTRLKKGRISAQFWAAYVPCEAQHRDAVQLTLEQIDVIKRLTDRYSPQLTTCTSAQDIIDAHKNQQLCSLTGVEGGHSLGGSLAVLRTLYAIGVRYMTLTSTCHTPWADSSYADAPTFNMKHGGLTAFGKQLTAAGEEGTAAVGGTGAAGENGYVDNKAAALAMTAATTTGGSNGGGIGGGAGGGGGNSKQSKPRSRSSARYDDVEKQQRKSRNIVSIPNTIKLSMLNSGLLSFERIKLEARDANNSLSKTIPNGPIDIRHFLKLCDLRRKFPVLYKLEFQTAAKVETNTCRHAMKKNNQEKNQNPKCIPYDYNRVVLEKLGGLQDSDYVNASYVDSLLKPNAYIVTQGPVEETVNAYWRMVWQENISAIVMLTKTFDFAKVMCVQYWPPNMEVHETYGDIHINIVREEQLANFHIRTFRLYKKNEQGEVTDERLILQFHYTEWYSHSCPFSNALLEFRRRVRLVVGNIIKDEDDMRGPILVHCSDGGGRSGVYMSIDANLELAEEEESFNVFGYLKKLRQSRKGLVENVEQYKFIYDTLEEHIICGKTWFPVSELSDRLKAKARRNSGTKMNEYQAEYDQICKQTPRFTIGDCAGGHRADNREKNRDVLCVPPDNFRPYLTSFQGNAFTDYINSVFVDGYTKPREYIVTEWPMKHTLGEFWSLVYDQECSAVVVLCQPPSQSQQYPSFWPNKSKMEKYGPVFSVHYVMSKSYTNIKQWEFKINKKIVSLTEMMAGVKAPTRTVQLFQLTCWPMGHKVPSSTNSLVYLMNMVEIWRNKVDYGPVCIVSPDGRSRAGVYCAANACIEQVIQHGEVDVFQAVKTVRRHRPQLVENMTEYKYCYDLVLHYVLHFLNKKD